MRHYAGKSLGSAVEGDELCAGPIVDSENSVSGKSNHAIPLIGDKSSVPPIAIGGLPHAGSSRELAARNARRALLGGAYELGELRNRLDRMRARQFFDFV
jgi:hypothetical protein